MRLQRILFREDPRIEIDLEGTVGVYAANEADGVANRHFQTLTGASSASRTVPETVSAQTNSSPAFPRRASAIPASSPPLPSPPVPADESPPGGVVVVRATIVGAGCRGDDENQRSQRGSKRKRARELIGSTMSETAR